jgi:hypothetical protein
MFQGFIGKEIQRTNRNLLVTSIGWLCIPVAIGALGWTSYWGDFFGGAKLVSNRELIAAPEKYIGRYVKVVGTGSTETGIEEVTKSTRFGFIKSENVSARIITIALSGSPGDNRAILVKLKNDATANNTVIGSIENIPYTYSENTEIKSVLDDKSALPVMLNAEDDFRLLGYIGLVIGLIGGLAGGSELAAWVQQQQDIKSHPTFKKLSTYGQPDIIAQSIDREINTSNVIVYKNTKITDTWLLHQHKHVLELGKLVDLVWIYFQTASRDIYGIIPLGTKYTVVCYDRNGDRVEITETKERVLTLIEQIHTRVPWAIVGYTDELELLWIKDRANFIAMVDKDRQNL